MHHISVKVVQVFVAQQIVVHQVPLSSAVVVARVVAGSGEVQPLGVAELVTFK